MEKSCHDPDNSPTKRWENTCDDSKHREYLCVTTKNTIRSDKRTGPVGRRYWLDAQPIVTLNHNKGRAIRRNNDEEINQESHVGDCMEIDEYHCAKNDYSFDALQA